MKNMDLLNICYKLFNRYIVVDELIRQLDELDKSKYSKKELKEINELIDEVKRISKAVPNSEDDFVLSQRKQLKDLISKLDQIPKDDENLKEINKHTRNLKKESDKVIDSHERWLAVVEYINDNKYFNECFDNMSKDDLLEFITQYIKAPFPPMLNQEEFDELVNIAIKKDERELLWRLAFNYENYDIKYDLIVDYFIKVKDGYYLGELISAVGEKIDIDKMIKKMKDKDLIEDLISRKDVISYYVSENQFKKLQDKIK